MARSERKDQVEVPVPVPVPVPVALLDEFRSCFSAWTFPVFCALACGLLAQRAQRTVCGMLRVRDVGGGTAVTDLEPPPGASVLLPLPLVDRGGLCDPGRAGGAPARSG
jgi:hypothetical protein